MRLCTWNVNSIRAREARALAWLRAHRPDVVCLQELKTPTDDFPYASVEALGYQATVLGQKTYNGVALLTLAPATDERLGLDDGVADPQARLVAATVAGVRVLSVYVPNGAEVGSDKWHYKLAFLKRLLTYLERHHRPDEPLIIAGDFNIIPDDLDAAHPALWHDTVLGHPEVRAAYQRLLSFGLVDLFRPHHPQGGVFSWWDYRQLGFQKNEGLRIDLVLGTRVICSTAASVDRDERKGEKPSDHAPVLVEIAV